MAYSDDISSKSADHHWKFDGDSTDAIGSANGTDTSVVHTGGAIAKDATNCMTLNAVGDRVSIPTTTDINNSAQTDKFVCGWFQPSAINQPFTRIYGEGTNSITFQMAMGFGNFVTFEVYESSDFGIQIYSDIALEAGRSYHLALGFFGNGDRNLVLAYIDGVLQFNTQPFPPQPNSASLAARGVAEFGDPAGTVGMNGTALVMVAPVNGLYNHWATWNGTSANTVSEIREVLFEKGALADVTITTGTESAMQTALDAYADTVRGNAPVCIDVEAVSGGGNLTLDLDNITFNPLASVHVRYAGTADTLTLRNINGANCSIVSNAFGGTVSVVTEQTLTVTVKDAATGANIENARVYLQADTGGPLTAGDAIVDKTLTNASGVVTAVFDYSADQPVVGVVRKGSTSTYYKQGVISGTITASGFDVVVLMVKDE